MDRWTQLECFKCNFIAERTGKNIFFLTDFLNYGFVTLLRINRGCLKARKYVESRAVGAEERWVEERSGSPCKCTLAIGSQWPMQVVLQIIGPAIYIVIFLRIGIEESFRRSLAKIVGTRVPSRLDLSFQIGELERRYIH